MWMTFTSCLPNFVMKRLASRCSLTIFIKSLKGEELRMEELKVISLEDERLDLPEVEEVPTTGVEVTVGIEPVEGENCRFKFTFTAKNYDDQKTARLGKLFFRMPPNTFENFGDFDPNDDELKLNGTEKMWTFGELGSGEEKTVSFEADYVGEATGNILALYDMKYKYKYDGQSVTWKTIEDKMLNVGDCGVEPPVEHACCEECPTCNEYTVEPCEHKIAEAPIAVAIQSRGRRLSVQLDLEMACHDKAVNVGVFLYEVTYDDAGNEYESPYAYKVVQLPPGDCECANGGSCQCGCDTRSCNCVDFEIADDESTACTTRIFRVKTKANYVSDQDMLACPCTNGGCSECEEEGEEA